MHDPKWYESDKSKTSADLTDLYIKRLRNILQYGLWMTEEEGLKLNFGDEPILIPPTPKVCFTELKLSESRKHARQYGRLGIGVKRPFLFHRSGRPLLYYGFHEWVKNDKFMESCARELQNKDLLNFFKPMNSSEILTYDFYSESEWRILFFKELLEKKLIKDPRDDRNTKEHQYFNLLTTEQQTKLKYLIPLDGWFAMIIYPSLKTKNRGQQDENGGVIEQIRRIKSLQDHGNKVEGYNRPMEVDLDACRHF
ncbi:MAG: hypothetical protein ABIU05_18745 [Nitrospirales bacterium]